MIQYPGPIHTEPKSQMANTWMPLFQAMTQRLYPTQVQAPSAGNW
ncbi:hypothetical protein [Cyclobacterium xiamenense]|nr:hypothetical protein [Cyclobacterium xiamenense]